MAKKHAVTAEASSSSSLSEPCRSVPSATPARSSAPFALTSDGALLINVEVLDALDDTDLRNRTLFVGAELAGGSARHATKPKPVQRP